jgi:hypothetical protein
MMKKAQGLSVNVIIVAALALIVLVILGVVFMGRMGLFGGQVSDCEANGGQCRSECLPDERVNKGFICPEVDGVRDQCCMGVEV